MHLRKNKCGPATSSAIYKVDLGWSFSCLKARSDSRGFCDRDWWFNFCVFWKVLTLRNEWSAQSLRISLLALTSAFSVLLNVLLQPHPLSKVPTKLLDASGPLDGITVVRKLKSSSCLLEGLCTTLCSGTVRTKSGRHLKEERIGVVVWFVSICHNGLATIIGVLLWCNRPLKWGPSGGGKVSGSTTLKWRWDLSSILPLYSIDIGSLACLNLVIPPWCACCFAMGTEGKKKCQTMAWELQKHETEWIASLSMLDCLRSALSRWWKVD